jgi:hypothetical protein
MRIENQKSCSLVITTDDQTLTNTFDSREVALKDLLIKTKEINYKRAEVVDFNTGMIVVSLRTIK